MVKAMDLLSRPRPTCESSLAFQPDMRFLILWLMAKKASCLERGKKVAALGEWLLQNP